VTVTKHETEIKIDTEVPMVHIIREFDAPVEKVFRAHTEPELFAKWMGPKDLQTRIEEFDSTTGGKYRYAMLDDGAEYVFYGSFHEVRPGELIVQTFTWEGMPDGVSLDKLSFEELPGGRTRLVSTSLVDSFAGRDAFVASGMEVGINEGYEKLDALLETM